MQAAEQGQFEGMGSPWTVLRGLAEVLASTDAQAVSLGEARRFSAERLTERQRLTTLSAARLFSLWARFERFAAAHEVHRVDAVTPELARRFVMALTASRCQPATATMHLRRDAIRLLFKVLREFGLAAGDPTVDVELPPRSGVAVRPLTDAEVDACRWAALGTVGFTRQPALWALGEAGASTHEIASVTSADVDLSGVQVWLAGGPRTDARLAPLTDWAVIQLRRRIRQMPNAEAPLAFEREVGGQAGRINAGMTLTRIMARAGLADDKQVRPRSLTAWVGRRVWLETCRIDEAARRLGLRSLDLTAELIGLDWRAEQDDE